jgi:ribA/ribD-fused uncharacterized protein
MTEKFTFFWGGPFSQWHKSEFNDHFRNYNCMEQFMMYHKAVLMGDDDTAKKILKTPFNPREYKALGRQVSPFDAKLWNEKSKEIVHKGNVFKFTQNQDLLKLLAATKETTLVEASPYDKIWGVGLKESDPRIQYRDQWKGRNLLGEILTEVRIELIGE